ncbi:hypothetical protein A2757_00360 [Candidatus Giovannonibacteria bacterium RIFCSPHIGHO2_01_FULL_48_47]|nr:MAG: hypothetical protein A2757_00360 [Candidatus Giovannonibacteria bacterium RIFCSPHIGHO2_01_FULL_48_47]OGF68732.1 MAG: hypothetical protein A3D61_01420 [Candidatus Giovannonibacteria bacterium RIFCSPHIGHO2_02_FULL_48_15]OGF95381.1 MAG: hypothetical protein A2433_02845 [Candidatus Giovannonibacteria bacterium RIFOXYC1_FULL_48_8]OGF96335.1 MAG: hypothetical protein A2613_02120 [Candidatus Giovannonibacteria bacterium RIFOXYD1_FULL_48_21]HBT81750.1 membrane protein insertion efficiency facto
MKLFFSKLIRIYQIILSPDQGIFSSGRKFCVLEPTCSEYTRQAILRHGVFYGLKRGFFRILRCHPFQKKFYDPVV